jgi:F-type H+-transporting ATPase subunit b
MRTRALLAGFLLAFGVLFVAAPAWAQEEGGEPSGEEEHLNEDDFVDHEAFECAEVLEGGGTVDECQEAPNPILPETGEIIAGGLSFLILFGALAKFAFPAIRTAMDERAEKIRSDLEKADTAKVDAEAKATEYQRKLDEAKTEAAKIMEEARQTSDQYRDQRKTEADAEIADLKERAAADVEASKTQALSDLRNEVADLAIGAAEQVVAKSLDRETNVALVEQYIDQVGSRS